LHLIALIFSSNAQIYLLSNAEKVFAVQALTAQLL